MPPLGLELRVNEVGDPGALEPRAFPEFTLPPEAKALKQTLRSMIAHICLGENSVKLEFPERVLQDGSHGLGRIPLTLMSASLSRRLPPFGLELRVNEVGDPGALEPCAFPEFTLPPKAKAFKQTLRAMIAHICLGENSVKLEFPERVLQDSSHGLGRIPLTLMSAGERKPKLGLSRVSLSRAKSNVPNQSARGRKTYGELKPGARCPGRRLQVRDQLPRFAQRIWALPTLVASHFGIIPV